jgi:hypothetical protein
MSDGYRDDRTVRTTIDQLVLDERVIVMCAPTTNRCRARLPKTLAT